MQQAQQGAFVLGERGLSQNLHSQNIRGSLHAAGEGTVQAVGTPLGVGVRRDVSCVGSNVRCTRCWV